MCVCVIKKHACLRLTARKSPRKHSMQLLHCPMKTFSVLASLAQAANPWLSKATCVRALYGIVGVSPNLLSISTSSLSLTCTVRQSHGYKLLEAFDHRVSVFLETFCDVPIRTVSACMVASMLYHQFIWSCLWTSCCSI